ncbi:baculoviral IAP repeat-containing protein 5-like isoform X1 [Dendroctonus ponderosae]|uniref:Uncharacterized protein n=1 Tax=Dendroctonus ponderosae TaxID=77166 RepID=U4TQX4_DENPD|nr:baculoviral IAP repeat-containing protein 5-like isoform X1 [Dendroctonus ponderosae]ERL83839.1 hypothetical protein D910_01097 [Dendroctonus ponderosae]
MCLQADKNRKAITYLRSEKAREATFTVWPFSSRQPCSIKKMAEAGFVFTGSYKDPDSVQCCFCTKQLNNWEANDEPWSEHLKHSPQCQFALMQKPQDLWTVGELIKVIEEYCCNEVNRKYEELEAEAKEHYEKMREMIRS